MAEGKFRLLSACSANSSTLPISLIATESITASFSVAAKAPLAATTAEAPKIVEPALRALRKVLDMVSPHTLLT